MKPFILAMLIAHGADASTSLVAFNQGLVERNPLIISTQPASFVTQIAAGVAFETWLLKKLSKKHPKWAKGLAFVQISGSTVWAVSNIRSIRKH